MNNKEKVIKKAYGDLYDKCKPDINGWTIWQVISHGVTNGKHPEHDLELEYDFYETKNYYGDGELLWRPKILKGIENNNDWVVIQNEEHYETLENGYYKWYNINTDESTIGDLESYGKYTHYKIISIDDKPLF